MAKPDIAELWLRDNDPARETKWAKRKTKEGRKDLRGSMLFLHPLEEAAWNRQMQNECNALDRGSFDGLEFLKDHVKADFDECLYFPFTRPHRHATIRLNGKTLSASRYMCMMAHGKPPTPQHMARHICGQGHLACVNPNHLRWGTAADNSRDMHLHTARPIYLGRLPKDQLQSIVNDKRLPNVIAVEHGIPVKAVMAIKASA